jgi:asparagine synthase (glutamine-hydrolysing)
MQVIAGVVGEAQLRPSQGLARQAIAAQARYAAGETVVRTLGAASFAEMSPRARSGSSGRVQADRWLIVADTRLDNRAELLARLGPTYNAALDDPSILLAAWIEWGAAGLDFIVGEYAFAIFDARTRTLVLARDSSSERPLFYSAHDGWVAFASMPSGLRALGTHAPSLGCLASLLGSAPQDGEDSLFAGIKRVRPGELVEINGASHGRVRHWQPHTHDPGCARLSNLDYIERYRHLLDEAVACRLPHGAGAVATHLSAGYDSSAVTATAARLRKGPLTAFTSAPSAAVIDSLPRGRIADESGMAAQTARLHGIEHVIVRETAPLLEVVRRQTMLWQSPVLSAFNLAWWEAIRLQAAARGATVLLTGEAGNLTINTGGLATLGYYVHRSMWANWWREARAAAQRPDVRLRGIVVNSFGNRLPARVMGALRQRFQKLAPIDAFSFLREEWREHIARDAPPAQPTGDIYRDRLRQIRTYDSGPLRKPAFAQCGIEEVDPTADRRLVEFSLTLPPDQLLRDGQSRPLARAALSDRVPAEVLDSRLRGLQSADWYLRFRQSDAWQVLEEIEPHPAVRELLDLARMRQAIEDWPDRDWHGGVHAAKYRSGLMSALAVGIFLVEH